MKKLSLILFAGLITVININSTAQTFTATIADTIRVDTLGSEIIFGIHVKNVSTGNISFYAVRKLNQLPQGWQSSLCLDSCFPPNTDSIATTPEFASTPLTPGEIREVSIHVYPNTTYGTAHIKLVFGNLRTLSEQYTYNFAASAFVAGVQDKTAPGKYFISANYPNPFNPSTVIKFSIASGSPVVLRVYDMLGKEVAVLINSYKAAGEYSVEFNGNGLPSGVYLYKVSAGGYSSVRKMILAK